MNDKMVTAELQEGLSGKPNMLASESLGAGKAEPGDLGTVDAESQESLALEESGVLPDVRLVDAGERRNDGTSTGQDATQLAESTRELEPVKPSLVERGAVRDRIPAHPAAGRPIEVITYEDGAIRQVFPDGMIVETRTDGMLIQVRPDHSVTIVKNDRLIREVKPTHPDRAIKHVVVADDGTVRYEYEDGTRQTDYRWGDRKVEYPDGTYAQFNEDGSSNFTDRDGQTRYYDMDGRLEHLWKNNPDGSQVRTDPAGRVDIVLDADLKRREFKYGPEGELAEIKGHLGIWKRAVDSNGDPVWVNQDRGQVWQGEFAVDIEGNLHYMPHDREAQAYVFTRDGRAVRVPRSAADPK
ncbi:MAG TPA: hypothetical protein V6D08_10655 [Candidatus Obscuribacterales bacterium]